jgi:hypothetical protein
MPALIQELLAEVPSGKPMPPLEWDAVGKWLRENYFAEPERVRVDRSRRRHELYCSAGDEAMCAFVNEVFKDPVVRGRRREWVEKAKYNNVLRRIVNELSTVYSEPAERHVAEGDEVYQELQRRCRQHEMLRRVNRWGNLHRNLAVGFRVQQVGADKRIPVIDVVTPDAFRAVAHPLDGNRLIALIFELKHTSPAPGLPGFVVWTDREVFHLSKDQHILTDTVRAHGFARMPWILFSLEPPAGSLLDSMTGEDLVAAHRAVWFENILLLKESKSATKQTVVSGDLASVTRGQALDSETPLEASDGVAVSTVDMSMDLSLFRATAQSIYETAAANYGIPPAVLMHQGVQSAEARELMRAPLKELRKEQIVYFRLFERELAEVQSMVLEADLPEFKFSMDDWRIDFGESQTPMSPLDETTLFEKERSLGLTDTVEELMRRNPDITAEQATATMLRHIKVETERVRAMKPLVSISGGMSTPQNDSPSPGASGEPGEREPQSRMATGARVAG